MCTLQSKSKYSWYSSSMDCLSTRMCVPAQSWDTILKCTNHIEDDDDEKRTRRATM